MRKLIPVILSGGQGTRLWPLSTASRPKQFLPLVTGRSLFQDTLARTRKLGDAVAAPLVVCNETHGRLVAEQLRELEVRPQTIVLEPVGRNTAPAVAIAALLAQGAVRRGEDPLLLVLPADHVIRDQSAFAKAVVAAIEAAGAKYLVTFGVVPDKPETGYGYILRGPDHGSWSLLEKFVEKPDRQAAEQYVASGRYLWNSGMFVLSARTYLEELERNAPLIIAACRQAAAAAVVEGEFTRLGVAFANCPSDSIDYAVMEKTARAAVVPLEAGWSDIGSWSALHEVIDKDGDRNVLVGKVIATGCRNSYVLSTERLVAVVGIEDCVVVETPDAVLVMAKSEAQKIKAIVDELSGRERDDKLAGTAR